MTTNVDIAATLHRKYGVLVEPSSLSDEVVQRLAKKINYPRITSWQTLKDWSDRVLGEGESVRFLLPQSPGRNTHFGTLRFLSEEARELVEHIAERQVDQAIGQLEEAEEDVDFDDEIEAEVAVFAPGAAEVEAITSSAQRGLNTLHALLEESDRWEPVIAARIEDLLKQHRGTEEVDTLSVMSALLDQLNKPIKAIRELNEKRSADVARSMAPAVNN